MLDGGKSGPVIQKPENGIAPGRTSYQAGIINARRYNDSLPRIVKIGESPTAVQETVGIDIRILAVISDHIACGIDSPNTGIMSPRHVDGGNGQLDSLEI